MTFTTLQTARTLGEADMLNAALQSAGFHPDDSGNASNVSFAGNEIYYCIRVPAAEAAAAREFLRDSGSSPELSK